MTWPSDLARRSTNPFSPENMITKNLMDQALKNERSRIDKLNRNDSERSSGSSQGSNGPHSQDYIKMKDKLFSNSSSGQKDFDSSTSSNNSGTSTLSGRIKDCSLL